MSVNKFKPHVWIIPEDDANRQLANGFLQHHAVDLSQADVGNPARGWPKVVEVFRNSYLSLLRKYPEGHVIILVDFDENVDRGIRIQNEIPNDVKSRVFIIGSWDDPEALRESLKMTFEAIGLGLAQDCLKEEPGLWDHPHLRHNGDELRRLTGPVKPILFK